MSSSAGEIIYKAFAPNLKIMLCVGLGYMIVKQGLFVPASAKGVSLLAINVSLPALIFSSIVTAFTPDNISAFGSLILVAVIYLFIGVCLSWLVREIFYVPMDFRWGIIVMGLSSNWGNLPIAIVQTLGKGAPFNGQTDVDLGIAYDTAFVLVMNTTFFPLGVHKLCALDFKEENFARPLPPPFKQRWTERIQTLKRLIKRTPRHDTEKEDDPSTTSQDTAVAEPSPPVNINPDSAVESPYCEKRDSAIESDHGEHGEEPAELKRRAVRYVGGSIQRKTSRASSFTSMLESTRPIPPTAPLDAADLGPGCRPTVDPLLPVCSNHGQEPRYHHPTTPAPSIHKITIGQRLLKLAKNFLMPNTIALAIALPCALIQPLKALFTPVDGWSESRVPFAPDDRPPLAFILETANFVGQITVPASLILLGASMGRLKRPEKWKTLPYGSIIAMTVAKMILVPIFGIFFVQALRDHSSLYPPEDKMRTFVAILCSGTPAAINQLVVTQLYNPEGTAHTLAMFLLLQYMLMPILSTALAGIALYVVE